MPYLAAAAPYIAMAASAVGTGISVYSSQQQAQNADALANYNFGVQQQNAQINAAAAKQQATWREQQANAQYQAQQQNAAVLNQQARSVEAQGLEEARRMRIEQERTKATQRAGYGKAGVTSEGTPLNLMAESAGLMELAAQDLKYKSDMEASAYDRKADLERAESGSSLFDAQVARYESAASETGYAIAMNSARYDKASGQSTAQGARMQGYGTLISGVGDFANQGYKYFGPSAAKAAAQPANIPGTGKYKGSLGTMIY